MFRQVFLGFFASSVCGLRFVYHAGKCARLRLKGAMKIEGEKKKSLMSSVESKLDRKLKKEK